MSRALAPDEALTPDLTALDRRVLSLLPDEDLPNRNPDALSAHRVAELLGTDDVRDTRQILDGLRHLGYVWSAHSRRRKVVVYWRVEQRHLPYTTRTA